MYFSYTEVLMKGFRRLFTSLLAAVIVFTSCLAGSGLKVYADDGARIVKLHYHRSDENYAGWDVWFWEYGKDGAGYAFSEEDGEQVATIEVSSDCVSLGFIVRTESWEKDVNADQFIDIAELASGTIHVYVESGVAGYTKVNGDDAVIALRVKSADYNGDGTISLTMTGDLEDTGASQFTVSGKDGDIAVNTVEDAGGYVYTLVLAEQLSDTSSYKLNFNGEVFKVNMPIVYSTEKFEDAYTYTGDDLGFTYSEDATSFRLWAPTAEEVLLNLYEKGSSGDPYERIEMTSDVNGTWVTTVDGDLNGVYYTFSVTVDGTRREACDPYARTTGVNGERAMVIDLDATDPEGWDSDTNPHAGEAMTDAIIYEAHIRDLTAGEDTGITNVGKFLGLTETGTTTSDGIATGLDHIKELGVTHLHLLPIYDFGSVNEKSSVGTYNWGYDPQNYNVPEGSYSTEPRDGAVRVSEMKQMVKALHDNDISVIMDVVYNHVYSASEFCFNQIVPGYFSRISDTGIYSNGSGCGNDTASERSMVKKYIVDSVNYWVEEYHIDGFRFDLVGLIDTETINEIMETVHETHPDVIFYGEGWEMSTAVTKSDVTLATMFNSEEVPGFSFFNDTFRDGLKGSVFDHGAGFVSGAAGYESKISRCWLGNDNWCSAPILSINYASCHDNNTLYDRLQLSNPDDSLTDIIRMNNLAAAIYLTAEGVPFMQAGEEMLRTKVNSDGSFNENSYNSGDSVNAIDYTTLSDETYAAVFEYYKGLIAFRKAHSVLRLQTAEEVAQYVTELDTDSHAVGFSITGGPEDETAEAMILYFNANNEPVSLTLPEGEWDVYVNDSKAGTEVIETVSGEITIPAISAFVATDHNASAAAGSSSKAGLIIAGAAAVAAVAGVVTGNAISRKKKK